MTVERYLRLIAGAFVLASLILAIWVSLYWLLFTAFVGLNLFQSGLTNWCPMMAVLKRLGVKSENRAGAGRMAAEYGGSRRP
jgi:Inner membrane protein YgaP-like, transmembrane domain